MSSTATPVSLYEQYRPRTWSDLIGHDRAKRKIECLRKRGLSGRAFAITGPSGTGKTSMAYLIAREIAADHSIMEVDAKQLSTSTLADIEAGSWYHGLPGPEGQTGRAYIINEAQGLTKAVARQCLVWLERLPRHVVVIFTSTSGLHADRAKGQTLFEDIPDREAEALMSRCNQLQLDERGLAELFAERAREIAQAEQMDGKPVAAYLRLVRACHNNFRRVLEAISEGEMLD